MLKVIDSTKFVQFTLLSTNHLKRAREIVECFSNFVPSELIQNIFSEQENLISREKFMEFFNEQEFTENGANDVTSSERKSCLLYNFFKMFDENQSQLADSSEIFCGMLCFLPGSKSYKLSLSVNLFDESGNGELTKRSVWRMLRSYLRGMLLFCSFGNHDVNEVAAICTSKIFAYFKHPSFVTLEDISNWYTFCGSEVSFWLELLDNLKWTSQQIIASSNSSHIFSNIYFCGVEISNSANECELSAIDVTKLWDIIVSNFQSQIFFEDYIMILDVLSASLTSNLRSFFQYVLFDSSPTTHQKFVIPAHIGLALSILCHGSKSQKLYLAFLYFPESARMSLTDLQLFFVILLKAISHFSKFCLVELDVNFDEYSLTLANQVMQFCNGFITFEKFGDWYNTQGFDIIPWLELLNCNKIVQ